MLLKKSLSIAILTILLCSQVGFAWAQAQPPTAPATPAVMVDCKKLEPKYPKREELDFSKPYEDKFELNFRVAFENASNQYHLYMECVFEGMVNTLLGSAGGDTSGVFSANAPNLPELLKPESACLKQEDLTKVLKSGSPQTLLTPLLGKYNEYVDHLNQIMEEGKINMSPYDGNRLLPVSERIARNLYMQTLVENEIVDALAALDTALNGLKELRRAFTMHVHFQCMLRNLEHYRHAMENLRSVVSGLPAIIENASMH